MGGIIDFHMRRDPHGIEVDDELSRIEDERVSLDRQRETVEAMWAQLRRAAAVGVLTPFQERCLTRLGEQCDRLSDEIADLDRQRDEILREEEAA
jgi:hypothetical protein